MVAAESRCFFNCGNTTHKSSNKWWKTFLSVTSNNAFYFVGRVHRITFNTFSFLTHGGPCIRGRYETSSLCAYTGAWNNFCLYIWQNVLFFPRWLLLDLASKCVAKHAYRDFKINLVLFGLIVIDIRCVLSRVFLTKTRRFGMRSHTFVWRRTC